MSSDIKPDVKDDEKHLLLDHNYDGIQELNHPLPAWWNFIFYAAIIYSVGYLIYYEFLSGGSLKEEFKVSHAKVKVIQAEFRRLNAAFSLDHYNDILSENGVKKGAVVFENNCQSCHEVNGKGDIGPNLTDKYWLLAKSTPESIYSVVFNGNEENGMPAWSELMTKDEMYEAVAFVTGLKNTHQPNGKAPQGEKVEE